MTAAPGEAEAADTVAVGPTVVLAPELRALFRACRGARNAARATDAADGPRGAPPSPPRSRGEPAGLAPGAASGTGAPDAAAPPWSAIRLRRDGARPLRFEGALLLARRTATPAGPGPGTAPAALWRHEIALFLVAGGGLVARAALEPPEDGGAAGVGVPGRPVHAAAEIAAPGDLAAFCARHDPARALAWCGAAAAEPGPAAFARRLRRDFDRLIAAAFRAAPLPAICDRGEIR